jgi:hypothetical protein
MAPTKTSKDFDDWSGLAAEFKKKKIFAYLPGELEYERSCATANLLYRFTRPHFVVQPENWAEVLTIVDRTYALKLYGKLTVKCGGHSYTGFSTVDQGIIVDLKRMAEVTLELKDDKTPDVAVIQAGARWGDVYRTLIKKEYRGYVVNGGRCPSVGVGGFILGGGLGPFGRTLGMGCDTLLGATIITVQNDKVVKLEVDEKNDKDLFWALKGGGVSAFGIVTEFRMKVCRLQNKNVDGHDGGVAALRYVWYPDQTWKDVKDDPDKKKKMHKEQDEKLHNTMAEFYKIKWDDVMTIDSNWMLDIPPGGTQGKLGIRFTMYYDGPRSKCNEALNKITDDELRLALQRRSISEPTTRFLHETLFLLWEEEARLAQPRIAENYYQLWCSFVFTGDPAQMKEIIDFSKKEQDKFEVDFKGDNASLWITFIHSGGEVMNKKWTDTAAYPWREGVLQCSVLVSWKDKWLENRARDTLLEIKDKLQPKSLAFDKQCGSYVNFSDATLMVGLDKDPEKPWKAYYGQHFEKLKKIKNDYDPRGHFKWPWETDTQEWRNIDPEVKDEKKALVAASTDSIASSAWDTYVVPPVPQGPAHTELYAPPYVNMI